MTSTLKQQAKAIRKVADKAWDAEQPIKKCKVLSDAANTLESLGSIGEKRIYEIPRMVALLQYLKKVCEQKHMGFELQRINKQLEAWKIQ